MTDASSALSILVVDDEASVRDGLSEWFRQEGWEVAIAADAAEALRVLGSRRFQVALLDIRLPGMDGLELQRRIRAADPSATIILMTAYASVETAVRAMKEGAYDYIIKPFQPDEFTALIRNAVKDRALLAPPPEDAGEIVGESPPFREALRIAESVAATDATVVLQGESGTGKELVARFLHTRSPRRAFPFVPVNIGALPDGLVESELFGHEKGAFTGAQYRRKGRIEIAHGGTLFLDEIGEISPKTQVDLLRVLETREITRLGGERSIAVDFRVVAATNRDLPGLVREGRFREDLFYRLHVVAIPIPPLRDRRADIPVLAEHFLRRFAAAGNRRFRGFSAEALDRLVSYAWPGNVRELKNAVERAVILAQGDEIRPTDFPPLSTSHDTPSDTVSSVERAHILSVLEATGGNISRASRRLGIDRSTLYRKIRQYGLRSSEEDGRD